MQNQVVVSSPLEITLDPADIAALQESVSQENLLSQFLENTLNFAVSTSDGIEKHKLRIQRLSTPINSINRQKVYIGKIVLVDGKEDLDIVDNLMKFGDLLSQLTDVQVEKGYIGDDADKVTLYKARIPEGYAARIPRIKLRHLPQHFFNNSKVPVVLRKTYDFVDGAKNPNGILAICENCEPIWTDTKIDEISEAIIRENYHWVSFKIFSDDNTIKSWIIGRDVEAESIVNDHMLDHPVLLGRKTQASVKALPVAE